MVFDKLINPQLLHNKPYLAIPTGFFIVLVAFLSTTIVFSAEYSVIVIAFASLLILPYVLKIFELDELNIDLTQLKLTKELKREGLEAWTRKCLRDGYTPKQIKKSLIENNLDKDILLLYDLGILDEINAKYRKESNFFSRHSKLVSFYCNLFFGMFLAFLILYSLSWEGFREVAFEHQLELIHGPRGYFTLPSVSYAILTNNFKVMLLCVLLSLFYGAGAILILTYNASIAGVLYGDFISKIFAGESLMLVGAYLPHTTLEILAYLFAAISGGILSKSVIEVEPGSRKLLLGDGLKFFLIAVLLTLISWLVEATVPGLLLS